MVAMDRLRLPKAFLVHFLAAGLALSQPSDAVAEIIDDPHPPLRWEQMIECELVVLGKYHSHEGKRLLLETIGVLKGPKLPPGAVIPVTLDHWYSIETGPTGWESLEKDAKPNGIPKLCYQQQMMNPGPLVPTRIIPVVREPTIYFLKQVREPKLERRGQVQPAFLADGWQQALEKRPMDLTFRLAQDVNHTLERDALEELHETRDATAIEQLLDWILSPPWPEPYFYLSAEDKLIAIGDRSGDVYDQARQRLDEKAAGNGEYRFHTLGRLLAALDSDRALRDFKEWSAGDDLELRRVAAGCVGFIANDQALYLTFSLLHNAQIAQQAVWSVRSLPSAHQGRAVKQSLAEQARLRERWLQAVKKALTDKEIADEIKQELHSSFFHLVDEPIEIDPASAERVFLRLRGRAFTNMADSEGHKLIDGIKRAPDPKFAPLLVRILKEIPESNHDWSLGETLVQHATLFPHAMRRELERQGLARGVPGDHWDMVYPISTRLLGLLETPQTLDQLRESFTRRQPGGKTRPISISPELRTELIRQLEHYIADSSGPDSSQLDFVFEIDPAEGKRLLDKALARRAEYHAHTRHGLLHVAVRYGHPELKEELLAAVRESIKTERENGQVPWSAAAMLGMGASEAYAEFLKLLDALNETKHSPFDNRLWFNRDYFPLTWELFQSHRAEYFRRVLSALESDSLPAREAGQGELELRFRWNFGFNARDFRAVRSETLAKLRPVVERLATMTETEIRGYVLRERGVKLDGPPGVAWLPVLREAVADHDPAVYENVLQLVEEFTGEVGCFEQTHRLGPDTRRRALAAYLADRNIQ